MEFLLDTVDNEMLWNTIQDDLPKLKKNIQNI